MLLPHNSGDDLILEAARQASQSKDKSLFSLLLRLDEKISENGSDHRVCKAAIALDKRPLMWPSPSRYIE
jgi:hypothetical protein